ncbi:MAG: hypothetical protein ACMXYF_03470 [Candidatus Woesearchaeota archaeon]
MKNKRIVQNLTKIGNTLANKKLLRKQTVDSLVDRALSTMQEIGGITGISTSSYQPIRIHNHTNSYTIPIQMQPFNEASSLGKKAYEFFETLTQRAVEYGASKRNIEFHLGKEYASKHHPPEWFRTL